MEFTACMKDTMQHMIPALPLPVYPSPGKAVSFGMPHILPSGLESLVHVGSWVKLLCNNKLSIFTFWS